VLASLVIAYHTFVQLQSTIIILFQLLVEDLLTQFKGRFYSQGGRCFDIKDFLMLGR